MRRLLVPPMAAFLILGAVPDGASTAAAADIVIGTGDRSGAFYRAGRAICRSAMRKIKGITCETFATAGKDTTESHANINNLMTDAVEFGLAYSDWQHFLLTKAGPAKYIEDDFRNLRSVFSLQAEPFTLVVRGDSGIAGLADLAGKRVNIGSPGSRERDTMNAVMAAMGWTAKSFSLAEQLPVAQQSLAFCHNQVQAMVYTVDHPDPAVAQVARLCNARIVAVEGPAVDRLLAERPYLAPATIPGGLYAGTPNAVGSFGSRITVVSSANIGDDIVYAVVKAVFEDLERFRRTNRAFESLDPGRMVRDGLIAPLHDGAKRYYREKALM